jgi:hypothetical protein
MREATIAVLLFLAAPPLAAPGQGMNAQSSRHGEPKRGDSNCSRRSCDEGYRKPAKRGLAGWITFPVVVPPAQALGGEPALVELYISSDRGASWQRYDTRNLGLNPPAPQGTPAPGQSLNFTVQLDRDGEYYFASRILDALNRPLYQPAQLPEQRVILDTLPPRLEFTAAATAAGEVRGQWRALDEHLQPETLTLEYQPSPNLPWQSVAFDRPPPNSVQTSLEGTAAWFPHTNELSVNFRGDDSRLGGQLDGGDAHGCV